MGVNRMGVVQFSCLNVGLHVGNSTKQYSFIYHLTVYFSQESRFNPFFCLRQQRVYTTVVCMIKKVWKMSFCLFFFSHCNQTWLLHFQQRMIQIRQIQTFNSLNVDSLMGSTSSLRVGSFLVNLKRTVYFCELSLKRNKRIGNKRVKLY